MWRRGHLPSRNDADSSRRSAERTCWGSLSWPRRTSCKIAGKERIISQPQLQQPIGCRRAWRPGTPERVIAQGASFTRGRGPANARETTQHRPAVRSVTRCWRPATGWGTLSNGYLGFCYFTCDSGLGNQLFTGGPHFALLTCICAHRGSFIDIHASMFRNVKWQATSKCRDRPAALARKLPPCGPRSESDGGVGAAC